MRDPRFAVQEALSASDGVLRRRDHADLVNQIDWLLDRGELIRILPGVYLEPHRAHEFEFQIRSVSKWDPDAVLLDRSAAKATFWPDVDHHGAIEVAVPRKRLEHRDFHFSQRRIPPDLINEPGADGTRPDGAPWRVAWCSRVGGWCCASPPR